MSTRASELTILVTGPEASFGVGAVEQDGDVVRGSMPSGLLGPDGRPSVGALGVLVDNVLGYSIIASLPPDSWTVSTEIWIDVIAPLPTEGGRIRAEGGIVQPGSFSTARVRDDQGRLLAMCRQRGRQIEDGPDFSAAREAAGVASVTSAAAELIGLLGLRPGAAAGSQLLDVTPIWENPRRMLHGGVSLAASEATATRSRAEAGCSLATTSIHIVHTRPVPYGTQIEFTATTVHAGRTLWVTDVTGRVDGRVCTTTRVTAQG